MISTFRPNRRAFIILPHVDLGEKILLYIVEIWNRCREKIASETSDVWCNGKKNGNEVGGWVMSETTEFFIHSGV